MKKNKPNVIFIGDTPLLYSCIVSSLNFFNKIYLITDNKKIKDLVPKKIVNIKSFKNTSLKKINFVFSIMNDKIINQQILDFTNIKFINFHDSFLPRYAGRYSSSWSIINNEKYHGITWHKVTSLIDGGDIYLSKKFKISKSDTAETLDLKSNFNGLELFKILIKKLKSSKIKLKKQNLSKRTYYGIKDKYKIPNYGFVNYLNTPETILRLYRALKFSPNKNNQFCKLKILTSKGVFEINEVFLQKKKIDNIFNTSDLIKLTNNFFYLKVKNKILRFNINSMKLPKSFYLKHPIKKNFVKYINFNL